MSSIEEYYTFTETVVNKEGSPVKDYREDLPHGQQIVSAAIADWNRTVRPAFFDDSVNTLILSCRAMRTKRKNTMKIAVMMKPGIRLTGKIRRQIFQDIETQFTDGWGEGFFGPGNIMSDGETRFMAW